MIPMKLRKHSTILIISLCAMVLWGFHLEGQALIKLDSRLQFILNLYQQAATKNLFSKPLISFPLQTLHGEPAVQCIIRTTGDPQDIKAFGGMVSSQFGDIITALIPLPSLGHLASLPNLVYVEASRPVVLTLDASVPSVKGDLVHNRLNSNFTGYTGKGVIIGNIDSGIDFTHPDFINPDGTSRILFIWDQTDPGGPAPAGFSYGTEWTQAQINDEIDGSPSGLVRQKDTIGHGTHTAGIAAGNGRATGNGYPAGRYIGMAPQAELIIVKSNLQTVSILDALNYIQNKAANMGRPCIINNSYGSQYGPHDGTRNWEIAFNNATGAGRVLVIAAGNNGNHHNITPVPSPEHNTFNQIHARATASIGSDLEITFKVPNYTADNGILNDEFEIDIWYQGKDKMTVKVTTPGDNSFSRATGEPYTSKDTDEGTIWINNASGGPDPNNGDNECYIYVADKFESKPPVSGTWKITITGNALPAGGTFDIWATYNTLTSDPYEIIFTNNFVNEVLVASPGTATKPITVAAYVTKNGWVCPTGQTCNWPYNQVLGDIAWYSSPGPRRDGVLKPELAAPGSNIAAARSKDWNTSVSSLVDDGVHAIKHGTSMAAPHVTGAVALLLEQNPSLSNDQVKSILTGTAISDAFTGTVPDPTWGYGKLDIYAAMGGTKSTQMVSGTGSNTFPFPNGNVIIDFTNHIGNDEVTVKMFTSPPPNAQQKVLSRHYNLATTIQHFEANLTFSYTQDEFDRAGFENGESSLSLWRSDNGGQWWEAVSSTVDPVNNTVTAAGVTSFSLWSIGGPKVVPIELSSFAASVNRKDVVLVWKTVSETNNFDFEIQCRQEENEFIRIGFIAGAGTTSEPHNYEFIDAGLADGTYSYRLKQIDTDGNTAFSPIVSVTIAEPQEFRLYANYPNPFNPTTTIRYDLPVGSPVELKVFNVYGQEVMRLVNEWQTAGHYAMRFDASHLTSGMYFYRLSAVRFSAIQKMLCIK